MTHLGMSLSSPPVGPFPCLVCAPARAGMLSKAEQGGLSSRGRWLLQSPTWALPHLTDCHPRHPHGQEDTEKVVVSRSGSCAEGGTVEDIVGSAWSLSHVTWFCSWLLSFTPRQASGVEPHC